MASQDVLNALSTYFAQRAVQKGSGTSAQAGAERALEAAQGATQARAMRRIKEQQEEEEKKSKWGGIGGTLGSIAGIAAAPFTGGASLAATAGLGALGGAAGNAAGQLVGGGKFSPQDVLMSGIQGGVSGLATGLVPKVEGLLNSSTTAPATGSAMSGATQAPAGGSAIGATNAAKAGYTNPFQASLHGAVPPSHPLGQGMLPTGQGVNLAKAAQGANAAMQHPGQAIAGQLVNYAKGQSLVSGLGLNGIYGFNQQERFNPGVHSVITHVRNPETGQIEEY
jgi:hypothetical protein